MGWYWRIPRLWPGERCFILGGGPSLPLSRLHLLAGRRTIAVNSAYKVAPWADVMIFGDCKWFNPHGFGLKNFAGLKITTCARFVDEPGLRLAKKDLMPYGVSTNPDVLFWNLSTGAMAINLAFLLGVTEIVLLGFDMKKAEDGRDNFHPDYGHPAERNPYPRFLLPFPSIKSDLDRLGVRVVNGTPGSALTIWPILDLAQEVDFGAGIDFSHLPDNVTDAPSGTLGAESIPKPRSSSTSAPAALQRAPVALGRVSRGTVITGIPDIPDIPSPFPPPDRTMAVE